MWLQKHIQARLVIIDTLAKVRRPQKGNGNAYSDDYNAVSGLQKLAGRYGVAILLIHHQRKMDSADPFDTVSGTLGLTGGVDSTWILTRERSKVDAVLHITGRDIDEQELALNFDKNNATWELIGQASEVRRTKEQAEAIAVLEAAGRPLTPTEVADRLGGNYSTIKSRLYRMSQDGQIESVEGKYATLQPPHSREPLQVASFI